MENQQKVKVDAKPKKLVLILVALLLVLIVAAVVALSNKKSEGPKTEENKPVATGQEEAAPTASVDVSSPSESKELIPVKIPNIEGAKVVVEGANAITKENIVVTPAGKATENVVLPMSETAPKQTGFLKKEDLPNSVAKISVGNNKFSPSEFTTKAGAPTTFSLTGVDDFSHVIAFNDPSLTAIAILVGPGQTKAITFNAPATPGTYTFYNASPGHEGEIGKMIVK